MSRCYLWRTWLMWHSRLWALCDSKGQVMTSLRKSNSKVEGSPEKGETPDEEGSELNIETADHDAGIMNGETSAGVTGRKVKKSLVKPEIPVIVIHADQESSSEKQIQADVVDSDLKLRVKTTPRRKDCRKEKSKMDRSRRLQNEEHALQAYPKVADNEVQSFICDKMMQIVEDKKRKSSFVEDQNIPLIESKKKRSVRYTIDSTNSQYAISDTSPNDGTLAGRDIEKNWSWISRPQRNTCMDNIGYRLSQRKIMLQRRTWLVDIACVLAVVGVGVMIGEAELIFNGFIIKMNLVSLLLKVTVSISTVLLVALILTYHVTGVQLIMLDNGLDDWRLFVTASGIFWIVVELVVCTIHSPAVPPQNHNVESVLSVLMFLRLYLMVRFLVVHSRHVSDTSTQSLGAINKVRIDGPFVFKALMTQWPGTVLMVLMATLLLVSSWSLRACETYMELEEDHTNVTVTHKRVLLFSNAMWLSSITFLTVGYGDIVPQSQCGRVTSAITGAIGVGITALLVAVLAQKLEQTRAEKYVHSFVSRLELDKTQKHAAANVIKNAMRLWRMKKNASSLELQFSRKRMRYHGKFLRAANIMREARAGKQNIGEAAIGVIEVNTALAEVHRLVETLCQQQNILAFKAEKLENRLLGLDDKLDALSAQMKINSTVNESAERNDNIQT